MINVSQNIDEFFVNLANIYLLNVINIFIEDLSAIFIQCFYLSQVVSFGYTPIYTIAKSVIHLGTNSHHIYQYKRNHSTNPCNPSNSAAEE
ncbi:hypothetical protein RhiirB3_441001 [Rhizophagus irregularis]|nr:hypothetical protein RhiirB3_441001 [Rhizophagus irregularis]